MTHNIGPNIKFKQVIPDELPDVPEKKGQTAGKVTILDDKIEGRDPETKTLRES